MGDNNSAIPNNEDSSTKSTDQQGQAGNAADEAQVAPTLEDIERQELLAMDLKARQAEIRKVLDVAVVPEVRTTSGLVEWYRLLAKLPRPEAK